MFHILIDGYNFLHASRGTDHDWTELSLEDARAAIVGFLASRRRPGREKVTVVFDGGAAASYGTRQENVHGVEVLFSEAGVTADEVIGRTVRNAPDPRSFLVVTADRQIRNEVQRLGAKIVGPLNFLIASQQHHEKRQRRPAAEPREKYQGTSPGEVEHWKKIFGFDQDKEEPQ